MSLLVIFLSIALLVILISKVKLNAFLSFLVVALIAGLLLGIDADKIAGSVQKGIGNMLGSLAVIIIAGAMLGKIVADSGATQQITTVMMKIFGRKYIEWGMVVTGFIIGIPLFYNVGFVIVVPFIFSVAYRYNLPAVYIGVPMLAAMSVMHGFLPPHPSPTALVALFKAPLGETLFYGSIISIPAVILAGPLWAKCLKKINAQPLIGFQPTIVADDKLPSFTNSILSSLAPVILIAVTTIAAPNIHTEGIVRSTVVFISEPSVAMLISILVATYTLGVRMGTSMQQISTIFVDAIKEVSPLLLIVAGSGAFKQVLDDSGVTNTIAAALNDVNVHPLVLGWLAAAIIRVCIGSATVAGLTAASLVAPLIPQNHVNPSLMVLSVGAGSLFLSHVNDAGFWLFKEYFNLTIRDTLRSWSVMETIISIAGLIGVLLLNLIIQ